jgi:hypothetical protein
MKKLIIANMEEELIELKCLVLEAVEETKETEMH